MEKIVRLYAFCLSGVLGSLALTVTLFVSRLEPSQPYTTPPEVESHLRVLEQWREKRDRARDEGNAASETEANKKLKELWETSRKNTR
jgi:hypothetical protein